MQFDRMRRREVVALLGGALAWPFAAQRARAVERRRDGTRAAGSTRALTPARPDLAAKHLAGTVEAQRFVDGQTLEVTAAQAPLREAPSHDAPLSDRGAQGRAGDDLRHERRRLGLGPARGRRLCRLHAGRGAARRRARRRPTRSRRCARSSIPARRSSVRRPRRCRSAAGSAVARDRRRVRGHLRRRLTCRCCISPRSPRSRPISSRWPSASSARRISGAARPASASTARRLVQLALDACGIACPRDTDMQEQALGTRARAALRHRPAAARRSDVLERPRRHRARRARRWCIPTPRATWRSPSSRSPIRSRASAPPATT